LISLPKSLFIFANLSRSRTIRVHCRISVLKP